MPTYEYKCLDCGQRFEIFQNMSDEPLAVCKACQGHLKRLIGAGAGIIFKGSGFYCTDYKKSGSAPSAPSEGSGGTSTSESSSSTGTSETTPAAKTSKSDVAA